MAKCDTAAFEADTWQGSGLFNWYVTFSFDAKTHKKARLDTPDRLYRFVERELERFGYLGPFVIVPHDNAGTRFYHAHCLLNNYQPRLCEQLTEKFRRYGNVQNRDDGPIRGRGAFLYCANRAINFYTGDAEFKERRGWKRRPRKRGKGGGATSRSLETVGS